jgi:hypothetical protein
MNTYTNMTYCNTGTGEGIGETEKGRGEITS